MPFAPMILLIPIPLLRTLQTMGEPYIIILNFDY
jgi:hypothetical protein